MSLRRREATGGKTFQNALAKYVWMKMVSQAILIQTNGRTQRNLQVRKKSYMMVLNGPCGPRVLVELPINALTR
jgi:hypothetical protein